MEELNLENKIGGNEKDIKVSFYITYAFLLTTATITFIEAMCNKDPSIRHILNLKHAFQFSRILLWSFYEKIK